MGSRNRSNTSTSNETSYSDNRNVIDAGGGVAGTGNQWDQSVNSIDNSRQAWDWRTNTNSGNTSTLTSTDNSTSNTSWNWDGSQRTDIRDSGNTLWMSDSSDRSTSTTTYDGRNSGNWNWDSSDRSTDSSTNTTSIDASDRSTTTTNITDGRAFELVTRASLAQTEAARQIALAGQDAATASAARAMAAATEANLSATTSAGASLRAALGFADTTTAAAFRSSRDALGWGGERLDRLAALSGDVVQAATRQADNATSNAQAAFRQAQDSSNGTRQMMMAGLGVVAVLALFLITRKG